MTKKILLTISLFLLVPFTSLLADEGDVERLAVPEMQAVNATDEEVIEEEPLEEGVIQDIEDVAPEDLATPPTEESNEAATSPVEEQKEVRGDTTETQTPQAESEATNIPEVQEQQSPEASQEPVDAQVQESPSAEELEAKHAEESELREVGAGEEPVE